MSSGSKLNPKAKAFSFRPSAPAFVPTLSSPPAKKSSPAPKSPAKKPASLKANAAVFAPLKANAAVFVPSFAPSSSPKSRALSTNSDEKTREKRKSESNGEGKEAVAKQAKSESKIEVKEAVSKQTLTQPNASSKPETPGENEQADASKLVPPKKKRRERAESEAEAETDLESKVKAVAEGTETKNKIANDERVTDASKQDTTEEKAEEEVFDMNVQEKFQGKEGRNCFSGKRLLALKKVRRVHQAPPFCCGCESSLWPS